MSKTLSPLEIKMLQAMRAGEITIEALLERYDTNYSAPLSRLKKKNMVEKVGEQTYKITDIGKEACPRRVAMK